MNEATGIRRAAAAMHTLGQSAQQAGQKIRAVLPELNEALHQDLVRMNEERRVRDRRD